MLGGKKKKNELLVSLPIEGGYIAKRQSLEFDPDILCSECDNSLGRFDSILADFFREYFNHPDRAQPLEPGQKLRVLEIHNLDTSALMLAFAASFLRLSYSKRTDGFNLGAKYEKKFAQWLRDGTIPEFEKRVFEAVMVGYTKCPNDLDRILIQKPEGANKQGAHFYFFHLPGMVLTVKVGQGTWIADIGKYPKVTQFDNILEIPLCDPNKAIHLPLVQRMIENNF